MTHKQVNVDRDELLGQVVEDFFEARERGESPEIASYLERYPEIADLLKVAIPAMRAAEDATTRSEPPSSPLGNLPERQLGDFRILRQLGRGGMGIVYEAEQISMKRRVALKVLPLAGLVDELKIQRFQNEVRAVAALDHPNIVSVYMIGEERGVHYYAMQLIRGRSLAQVITSLRQVRDDGEALTGESVSQITMVGQPDDQIGVGNNDAPTELVDDDDAQPSQLVTVAQADDSTIPHVTRREYFRSVSALGIQAATALQHAHDRGIVHRDIKPANLLLETSSKLYVTDFGLARIEADVGVTMTGDMIGTLRYMAPEQALAKRVVVDHRADIYSLAVTIYELLTLRPVYLAEDRQQLLKQIAFDEPTRLRRVDPEIPSELETIILKAMSKDMEERYESARELADDLRCFLEHRPIMAKPPVLHQRIAKWTRRNPTLAWAVIITLSLVTIAFGISTMLVMRQFNIAVRASQETKDQLRIATVTRLAAEARALQDERPIQSVLLAVEAVELSQQDDGLALPIAHETLLNATQRLRSGRTLTGHGTKISALSMSSDWLVTRGEGQAHLWDLTAKDPSLSPRALGEDNDVITAMAISEDGRWLVTGGSKLQRWDLNARNPNVSPLDLAAGNTAIVSMSQSANGRWLATQDDDGTATLWDLVDANHTTSRIVSRQTDTTRGFAVSPDGRWLVAVPNDQSSAVQLWDLHANNVSAAPLTLKGHNDRLRDLAISSDSRWLATASQDREIRVWDLKATDTEASSQVIPTHHNAPADMLRFSRDSQWLFAGAGYAARILCWNMLAGDRVSSKTILPHKDRVSSMDLSRDGRWLISGSLNGNARFWDLSTDEPSIGSLVVRAHDKIQAVAIHPDGRWFATAGGGTARLWDLHGTDPASSPFVLQGQADDVFSATAISSSGRWIATSVNDNAVQLWDIHAKDPSMFERVLRGPQNVIRSLEISPDDRWLVAGSRDGAAHLWDLTSEDIPKSVNVLGNRGNGDLNGLVVFSPDNRWLGLASNVHHIQLWDLSATDLAQPSRVLSGHESPIVSMAISPDSRWLVTGAQQSDDSNLRIWDLNANEPQASSRELNPGVEVFSLTIDANSRCLATPGLDYTAWLWGLSADDPAISPRVLPPVGDRWGNGRAPIWRIAISPDAKWLFTSRFDSSAQLWDLSSKAPTPYELRGHNGVQSAAISPDGRWLVAGCRANAHLWDLTADDPASTVRVLRGHEEPIWSVGISADSRWLVTDSSDATIRRWCLDIEWLLSHAREAVGRELTDEEREYYLLNTLSSGSPSVE